jgi:polyhydroxybutyrate depolymerase
MSKHRWFQTAARAIAARTKDPAASSGVIILAAAMTGCASTQGGDSSNIAAASGDDAQSGSSTGSTGVTGTNPPSDTSGVTGSGSLAASPEAGSSSPDAGAVFTSGGDATLPEGDPTGLPDATPGDGGEPPRANDAEPPSCTQNTLRPGNTNETIQQGGTSRTYIIHVPMSYTGKTPVPLVIDLHGSGANAQNQMGTSGWLAKSDATGFIVIYPNALSARWNAGTCCPPSSTQNVDDVGFLRAVVDKTTTDGCIDRKHVYATGLSGGGLMSYRLGCMAADVFAAIAPVSGATVTSPCTPSEPVSVVAFRGLSDPLVPYDGGMPLQWYFQGAKADFDEWSQLDQCAGGTTSSHNICQTDAPCAGGSDVTLCTVNGGHVLYGAAASQGAAVPDVAWQIFQQHALP